MIAYNHIKGFRSLLRFFKSTDFYKGLILTLAILLVLVASILLGYREAGISLCLGVFICAPADVQGSFRHRIVGILISVLLGIIVTILIGMASGSHWSLVPTLGLLVFFISYLAVYGFRASLVAFSGLMSIILSFAHPQTGSDLWIHAGLMGLGGIWYLVFSHSLHLLVYRRVTEQLLAECMDLTARYLKTRGALAKHSTDEPGLQQELFALQTDLNEKHETLRELLLSSRRHSGQTNFARRQVLIFIELIDIMELAVANTANLRSIGQIYREHPERIQPLIDLITDMSRQLEHLSKVMAYSYPMNENPNLEKLLEDSRHGSFQKITEVHENNLLLQNVYDYLEKQAQKIDVIQKVMNNLFEKGQVWLRKESSKFITQQDYDWKTFADNLSFRSPIFKHSLRLTVTMFVGYAVGALFPVQNAYWILLTIIVIMRPGYNLTKQRSKHRIYGTLLGGAIAVGIVLLIRDPLIYGLLAIVTFILAYALVQKNYKYSAMFITLSIIFIYALIRPDVLNVIQFRVLDTLTGASLAIVANTFLWPAWEFLNIHGYIGETITANRRYLQETDRYYHHKDNLDPSYKLSRKTAFLAIGNLNAAFQRMAQEPKSKQKNLDKIYEIVALNHTFLSLTAALGTYIRHHKTTAASQHFETYIAAICNNLNIAYGLIEKHTIPDEPNKIEISKARRYLDLKYRQLAEKYNSGTATSKAGMSESLQELKIISDQLKWLYTISENLKNVVRGSD